MKKPRYKFLFFCLFLLLACTFLLTGCGKSLKDKVEEKEVDKIGEEIVFEDFSKFSDAGQGIGDSSNETYEISSLTEKSMDGFHRFIFEVEGDKILPNVSANIFPEFGVIVLLFSEIEKDNSGLGYGNSYDIGKEGIVRVFHRVSTEERQETYAIGISKPTDFLLHSQEIREGKWNIFLDVRYPGELEIEIDRGNDGFSLERQSLQGAIFDDGASIGNYFYWVESNVFSFIWTVSGGQLKPIPKVSAEYNEDDELVVIFEDASNTTITGLSQQISLIGDVEKVFAKKQGNESIYRFILKEKKNFRLTSALSPHQVILEIEL